MIPKPYVASCKCCGEPTQHEEHRIGRWTPIGLSVVGTVLFYIGEVWTWVAALALLGTGIWFALERQQRVPSKRCTRCPQPVRTAASGLGGGREILRRSLAILGVLLLLHAAAPGWSTEDYFGIKRVRTFSVGLDLYELRVVESGPFGADNWQELGRFTQFEPMGISTVLLVLGMTAFIGSRVAGRRAQLANGNTDAQGPESHGAAGAASAR